MQLKDYMVVTFFSDGGGYSYGMEFENCGEKRGKPISNGAKNGTGDRFALRPLTRLPFRRKEGRSPNLGGLEFLNCSTKPECQIGARADESCKMDEAIIRCRVIMALFI